MDNKHHQVKKSAPLMYIDSQKIQPTAVNVQQVYHIYKKDEETQERLKEVFNEVEEEVAQQSAQENKEKAVLEDEPSQRSSKSKQSTPAQKSTDKGKNKKPFRKLNVKEKLNFLNSFPPFIPKPECEIITMVSIYKGRITGLKDEKVTVKLSKNDEEIIIPSREITSINILTV